jgi:hypothetical protein
VLLINIFIKYKRSNIEGEKEMKILALIVKSISVVVVFVLFCTVVPDACGDLVPPEEDKAVQSHVYNQEAEAAAAANAEWRDAMSAAMSVTVPQVGIDEPALFEPGKPDPLIEAIENVMEDLYIEVLRLETADPYPIRGSGKIIEEIWEEIDELFE